MDSNFLADRICSVAESFFDFSDTSDELREKYLNVAKEFIAKLFDKNMILSICKFLMSDFSKPSDMRRIVNCVVFEIRDRLTVKENMPNLDGALSSKEIFLDICKNYLIEWKSYIIKPLIDLFEKISIDNLFDKISVGKTYLFSIYSLIELFIREDRLVNLVRGNFFDGFFRVFKDEINESLKQSKSSSGKKYSIQSIRDDECVKNIRQFYNVEIPLEEDTDERKFLCYYEMKRNSFMLQCNFIWDNYCEHKDVYRLLAAQNLNSSLNIDEWFDIIDKYYQNLYTG